MHLIATIPGGWNPNDEGVFYIDQSPGDIVFLSAADTDLFMVNKAYHKLFANDSEIPSIRLANLTYFKQELTIDTYIEEVVSQAKIVVLKLLGGKTYFNYLCEAIIEECESNGIRLIFMPGDDKPDLDLMNLSSEPLKTVDKIWKSLCAGGMFNTVSALCEIMQVIGHGELNEKGKVEEVPEFFLYHPQKNIEEIDGEYVLIFTYRSYFLADNLSPIDELVRAFERKGITAISFMAAGYREANFQGVVNDLLSAHHLNAPSLIINTTGFSLQGFQDNQDIGIFDALDVPVVQAIMASCNRAIWEEGSFGLPPTDIAMNIALPEVDGKIITKVISFKEPLEKDTVTDSEIIAYTPNPEGCDWLANFAKNWMQLQKKRNLEKKVALVLPNYPNKNSRLANGVGLDTPQSTLSLLRALDKSGYFCGDNIPQTTEELIEALTQTTTNSLESLTSSNKAKTIRLSEKDFLAHYQLLSRDLKEKIQKQWGHHRDSPLFDQGTFLIPGFLLGNIFVSIQPSRGYNLDLQASYHSPDLPPPPAYLAYYFWLQNQFKADAVVHVGKHGNLEWLPGKGVTLGEQTCFPAAILGAIPHFYPFIINDPGEGTQAKRRNQAIILDHLIPPMTRAENYGDLLKLELLIDEFYECALTDKRRADLIKRKIEKLVSETHLQSDFESEGKDIDELLGIIDGYLCELKEAQIRGGLHILAELPEHQKLVDLVIALHRVPQGDLPGISQALAKDLQLDFNPLDCDYSHAVDWKVYGIDCRSYGQVIEVLENRAKQLVSEVILLDKVVSTTPTVDNVLKAILSHTLPTLSKVEEEAGNLIVGLNGRYVPSGGSGAPTRGRLDILPTGRNFFSVDVRTVPTEAAYELGVKSAQNLIDRYLQEHGEYPTSVGLSVWGTSTMRTGGDDIAQALALIGVKPIWQGSNRRVKDFEVISTLTLNRPRIDVMLRISGFFRDAFPDLISLFNAAVEKVAYLDESDEMNPIKARVATEQKEWEQKGLNVDQAIERSLYRVFGSKPGAYGAGLQGLIDEKNWTDESDLARAYMNWSGYAYAGRLNEGRSAHETFEKRLAAIDIVLQNQDNREHDLLDSDDYYQFQGGMTAAVKTVKGEDPVTYFGDHSRPENPRIKTLKEELLKVFRSRVVNPKWMKGMRDHGYKGAFEMAATMDYLFAYDATTGLIEDFMYEKMAEEYLFNSENQAFVEQHNPWALKDMSERMLEAIQRGMWKDPSSEIEQALKELYLKSENIIE
ncbi:MAG: cobaltochelatase subunit CobN [Crocinitomicaceae bacterium]|nr:cobaltochelatase subunit CobN [Crocinitomicaceae bacterium]